MSKDESGSKMLNCPIYFTLCYNFVTKIKGITTWYLLFNLAKIYPSNPCIPSYSSLNESDLSQNDASQLILKGSLSAKQLLLQG